MNCTHCGNLLDTQAIQQGACQYCGQAIPKADTTGQSEATFGTVGYPAVDSASQSVYSWKDWPATNAPPSGPIDGAGQTRPTLPQTPPPDSAPWSGADSDNDAPTLPGPLPFAASAPPPTGAAARGPVPAGGTAAPGTGTAPAQPQPAASPASGAPPRYVPPKPARTHSGKRLALAGVIILLALALIGGGLLFASSFNNAPGASAGVCCSAQPTTSRPGTPSAGQPSPTPGALTPTAAPSPTSPPALTHTYTGPGNLYTIRYPDGWTAKGGYVAPLKVFDLSFSGARLSSGSAEFVILTTQQLAAPPPGELAQQVDDAFLRAMNGRPSPADVVIIGGQSWTEESADTRGGKHTVIDSISFQGRIYTLWYDAPAGGEFNTDDSQFFTPMRNSFMFGA